MTDPGAQEFSKAMQQFMDVLRRSADKQGVKALPERTPEENNVALERMKALNYMLREKPRPVLEQLESLGITYQVVQNVPDDRRFDTVVLLMKEVEAADAAIAAKGSLYDQMYGKDS